MLVAPGPFSLAAPPGEAGSEKLLGKPPQT